MFMAININVSLIANIIITRVARPYPWLISQPLT